MSCSLFRNTYIASFDSFRYKVWYLPFRKALEIKLPIHILEAFKESIVNQDELHRYKTTFKIKFIRQLHFCALKDNSTFKFLTVLTCYSYPKLFVFPFFSNTYKRSSAICVSPVLML